MDMILGCLSGAARRVALFVAPFVPTWNVALLAAGFVAARNGAILAAQLSVA